MPRQTKARSTRSNSKGSRRAASDIALPGEKVVKETPRTVGVDRVKEGRDARRPIAGAALDRRRDVAPSGPAGISRGETRRRGS